MRSFILRVQRNAALAVWPAVVAGVVGPLLIALVPVLRGTVAEFLPPGSDRLLVSAIICASGAEIVRSHLLKFRLARRLRAAQAEMAVLRRPKISTEGL